MVYSFFVSLIYVFFSQPGYHLSASWTPAFVENTSFPVTFLGKTGRIKVYVKARCMSSWLRRNGYNYWERMVAS